MTVENTGALPSFVAVPMSILDRYLSVASGVQWKVLLAVLRQNTTDPSRLGTLLSLPKSDVAEALFYWQQEGVLKDTDGVLSDQETARPAPFPLREPKAMPVSANTLTAAETAETIQKKEELRFLFSVLESLYGRPLTQTEIKGYVYICEYMGLPADVILMAAEYCIDLGKGQFSYIQKVCANWAEEEINTHTRAEEYLKEQTKRHSREETIRLALGISSNLSKKQREYIAFWFDQLGFDSEMILLAYERTMDRIGQLSFPYMSKILENWHQSGIATPKDAKQETKPSKKKSGKETSYDLKEFERRSMEIPKID